MKKLKYGFFMLFPLLACGLHLFSSISWSVGVSHDSVFYLSAAQNFRDGNGFSWISGGGVLKPLIHFPPFYPFDLSIWGRFIGDLTRAATWNAALLFGLNVFLAMGLIYLSTKSMIAAGVGGILSLLSPVLLDIHLEAMSEPLYLLLMMSSLGLLSMYLSKQRPWQMIMAAILASLAFLTRYIGISVAATGVLSILLFSPLKLKRRWSRAIFFGMIAIFLNMFWYVRNYSLTGSMTNRVLSYHLITTQKLYEAAGTIASWFVPENFSFRVRFSLMLFVIAVVAVMFVWRELRFAPQRKREYSPENTLPAILLIHVLMYGIFLIFSLTFVDASTRLNNRILIPVYTIGLILAVVSFSHTFTKLKQRSRIGTYAIGMVICLVVLVSYAVHSFDVIGVMRTEGRGFSGREWKNSEMISVIQELDRDMILYSNEAFPIYYLTGIPAYWVPEKIDPVQAQEREYFEDQIRIMRGHLNDPHSALVLFHPNNLRKGMPSLQELTEGLVPALDALDGVIYVDPSNFERWAGGE